MANKKAKGPRSKSRHKLRRRGKHTKATVTKLLKKFEVGQRVHLIIDGSHHSGLVPSKYKGHTGRVIGKQGSAYKIKINDMNKEKILITTPAHLKEVKEGKI